jgi:hypothetical protein
MYIQGFEEERERVVDLSANELRCIFSALDQGGAKEDNGEGAIGLAVRSRSGPSAFLGFSGRDRIGA